MNALRIGRLFGIDIFLHWTFGLLLAGAPVYYVARGATMMQALAGLGLILAVFGCVVLHEFGHALTARRYAVPTKDITLYPIGGVARLQRIPEHPTQELLIAIAGPLVNVVVAVLVWGAVMVLGQPLQAPTGLTDPGARFWSNLFWINAVLVGFNLLPAFPMDGGRILRALLAYKLDYARATKTAATVGQGMAILFGLFAVAPPFDVFLLFIAMFVYLGAQQEKHAALMRTVVRGVPVRQAMLTQYATLGPGSTLDDAVDLLLDGSEQDFPVIGVNGQVAGVLTRKRLLKALAERDRRARVMDVMEQACPAVEAASMLDAALRYLREDECSVLPVTENGRLVGIVTKENVAELLMLSDAIGKRTGTRPTADAVRPSSSSTAGRATAG